MLLALPFLTLGAMAAVGARRWGWRDGFLLAWVGLLLLWWASATLLSPFHAFGAPGIAGAYVVVLAVALVLLRRARPARPDLRPWLRSPWVWALLVELGLLVLLAVTVAPNNFDSMAYHLPKVEHWLQSGQVGPFKTAYAPQIYLPPLAEVGMAHMSELGRVVWAVNLVQLVAHVVTLVGVSVVARNFGLDLRGQAIAAAVAGLTPLAVSEAVTTQTDYVVAATTVVAFAWATRHRVLDPHWGWFLLTAVTAGLGLCVKPIVVLAALPAVWWAFGHLRGVTPVRAAGMVLGGVVLATGLNVGWMLDNVEVFGSPLGPPNETTNGQITPGIVAGNVVRNSGTLLGTPFDVVNDHMADYLRSGMRAVGIAPDEPDAILGSPEYVIITSFSEDTPPNVFHGLLAVGALLALLVNRSVRRKVWPLAVGLVGSFLLYAVLLRWQVWTVRLFLPLIVLSAVLVAAWVVRWPRRLAGLLLVVLVAQSVPWVVWQEHRPLVGPESVLTTGPEEELFAGWPELRTHYERAVREITAEPGARVGLGADMFQWEYPLWYLLHQADPTVVIGNVDGTGPDRPGGPWTRELRLFELRAGQ